MSKFSANFEHRIRSKNVYEKKTTDNFIDRSLIDEFLAICDECFGAAETDFGDDSDRLTDEGENPGNQHVG